MVISPSPPLPILHLLIIDSKTVKPILDPTLRVLKTYAPKIVFVEVDRLLAEIDSISIQMTEGNSCRLLRKKSEHIFLQR